VAPVGRGRRRRLIARAATLVQPRHPCLLEALLLWWEALAAGEPASLVVGAETAPLFAAHAWVERQDGSLLGPARGLGTRRRPAARPLRRLSGQAGCQRQPWFRSQTIGSPSAARPVLPRSWRRQRSPGR